MGLGGTRRVARPLRAELLDRSVAAIQASSVTRIMPWQNPGMHTASPASAAPLCQAGCCS